MNNLKYTGSTLAILLLLCGGCNDKKNKADAHKAPSSEDLDTLKAECGRIMPKTFAGVWVGMTEEELIEDRPEAVHQPQRTDPKEHRWYTESSPTGVKVWYGVDRESDRLAVVQFAHLFDSWDTFGQHASALVDRFGSEYELYSCPSTSTTQKMVMTRLLWPRQPIAVMEAVLEMGDSVSVTMIVARVADCREAIEKQHCQRIDKDKALDTWVNERIDAKIKEAKDHLHHGHGVTPPNAKTPHADHVDEHEHPGGHLPAPGPTTAPTPTPVPPPVK